MNKNSYQDDGENNSTNIITQNDEIRYVALGDSYTIGEGVFENERYPNLLADHLRQEGVKVVLVANPAVTGYTVKDAITYELPVLESSEPDFVTLLIGANDVFSGDTDGFRRNLQILLDGVQGELLDKSNLIILTIPDFSTTPYAQTFGYTTEEIQTEIKKFNDVIRKEVAERNLKIVDLYHFTGKLGNDPTMIVADGLHPSGKQFTLWEKEIFPVAYNVLK